MSRTNPPRTQTIQYDVRRNNFSIRLRGVHAGEPGSELSKLIEGSLQTSLIASNPRLSIVSIFGGSETVKIGNRSLRFADHKRATANQLR
jgi:hypothetical protein